MVYRRYQNNGDGEEGPKSSSLADTQATEQRTLNAQILGEPVDEEADEPDGDATLAKRC